MKPIYTGGMIICTALAVSGGYLDGHPGYGSLIAALVITAFTIADQFDRPKRIVTPRIEFIGMPTGTYDIRVIEAAQEGATLAITKVDHQTDGPARRQPGGPK